MGTMLRNNAFVKMTKKGQVKKASRIGTAQQTAWAEAWRLHSCKGSAVHCSSGPWLDAGIKARFAQDAI